MRLAHLVDTDWVIDHFHGVEGVTRKLEELRPAGLAISVVSLAELYEGIHYSRDPAGLDVSPYPGPGFQGIGENSAESSYYT